MHFYKMVFLTLTLIACHGLAVTKNEQNDGKSLDLCASALFQEKRQKQWELNLSLCKLS